MNANKLLLVAALLTLAPLLLPAQMEEKKTKLETESFFKALSESDAVFHALYRQGGKTRARVKPLLNIIGKVSDDEIIKGMDEEKIRLKFKIPPLKSDHEYIFFVKRKGSNLILNPDGVTIPVSKDKVNFSLFAPYQPNFHTPFDIEIFKLLARAVSEDKTGAISSETTLKIKELFKKYREKGDSRNLKAILGVAARLSLKLDEESYSKVVSDAKSLGCLAVKSSAKIMGKSFFENKILTTINSLSQDSQVAAIESAIEADTKKALPVLAKYLQKTAAYTPPSSECFPVEEPLSNKAAAAKAVIEINGPETPSILEKELLTEDMEWLSVLLGTMSNYEGEDLLELALVSAAKESFSARRMEFLAYFEKVKSKETEKSLRKLYEKEENVIWKKLVISILGKYHYPESLDFLTALLNEDPHEEVRASAAMSMGKIGDKKAAKPLFDFVIREKSILTKTIAIDALAEIPDRKVQDYLKEIIKKSDHKKVREEAANAIEDNLFILRYGKKK